MPNKELSARPEQPPMGAGAQVKRPFNGGDPRPLGVGRRPFIGRFTCEALLTRDAIGPEF